MEMPPGDGEGIPVDVNDSEFSAGLGQHRPKRAAAAADHQDIARGDLEHKAVQSVNICIEADAVSGQRRSDARL